MEIVIMEKRAYDALMNGIDVLIEKAEILQRKCNDKRLKHWLDGEEVCRILNVSPRTLQSLRDTRKIAYSQINRKFFYKPEDVEHLIHTKAFYGVKETAL